MISPKFLNSKIKFMFKGPEFFNKEVRHLKDGKDPDENNQGEEIETVIVGQPGLDQHLVAETDLGGNQLEVEKLSLADLDKAKGNSVGAIFEKKFDRDEEIKAIREILIKLSTEGGQNQIMGVKEVTDMDINGEKFTITESNREEVEKILVERGYEIINIVANAPEFGFRARKTGKGEEGQDLDLVFFISRKK